MHNAPVNMSVGGGGGVVAQVLGMCMFCYLACRDFINVNKVYSKSIYVDLVELCRMLVFICL